MIFDVFYGFRADRTPPGPMNLLYISMVWGAFGRPGARRGAFSTFYVKFMKTQKYQGNSGILGNFKKFNEDHDFYGKSFFCESGGPKTLLFLRKY